jgi:hypothetical protein
MKKGQLAFWPGASFSLTPALIHRDLEVSFIQKEIKVFYNKYVNRLRLHINVVTKQLHRNLQNVRHL